MFHFFAFFHTHWSIFFLRMWLSLKTVMGLENEKRDEVFSTVSSFHIPSPPSFMLSLKEIVGVLLVSLPHLSPSSCFLWWPAKRFAEPICSNGHGSAQDEGLHCPVGYSFKGTSSVKQLSPHSNELLLLMMYSSDFREGFSQLLFAKLNIKLATQTWIGTSFTASLSS